MSLPSLFVRVASALLFAAAAGTASAQTPSRGELLYSTHCLACHGAQLHWRDKKSATDWTSLQTQVRHWQAVSSLGWSEQDITEVTRHLNQTIYHFELPSGGVMSRLGTPMR